MTTTTRATSGRNARRPGTTTPAPGPLAQPRRRSLRRTRSGRRRLGAAAALVAALSLVAACSGGTGDGASSSAVEEVAPSEADGGGGTAQRSARDGSAGSDADLSVPAGDTALDGAPDTAPDAVERAIISTGNVALQSKDVEQAAFDAQQVVDTYAGQITEQETAADEDGEVVRVRMVLRIPAADFTDAFDDLEQVASLTSSGSTSEDVTTAMIDTAVRIRAQRRSLARVEVLLDRATSISDIVRIEAQLTRRQAALDSLVKRQGYLQDQTSMSTLTVTIERTPEEDRVAPEEDEDGFLAGLAGGWTALTAFATGLATVAGWLLPFLAVLALVLVPIGMLARTRRRRTPQGSGG